jgi:hypothetical protein
MTAITTAARLLRVAADELKNAHTLGGDWGNELEALDAYNEHMATATTLEHMARQCLAPAGNEEVAFTKWFQCQQGTPYQGMWEFARAAWMARAAAPALDAPAAPATSAQVQALHRARRALHAIGKTYDDSELLTRALEADEEIDRMLAAAPQTPAQEAPAAPAVPAGFALVPIEPTQQMLDAGRWSGAGSVSIQEEWARKEMWSRMLATITPPPAAYTDDLVALVENLAQALSAAAPDNDLAGHALNYLKRNGLQESPLRAAEAAPQAPAAPAEATEAAGKAHDWRDNASYGGETCAECGATKGSRRGNAPCTWPPAKTAKRWPFLESPGEFTARLEAAIRSFGSLLPAVRNVLIERPPTLAAAPAAPAVDESFEDLISDWAHGDALDAEHYRTLSQAARDVLAERRRQVNAEGFSPERDDQYVGGQLAGAAISYLILAAGGREDEARAFWPWRQEWLKPGSQRRYLEKACALGLAEMERMDRSAALANGGNSI